VGPLSDHTFAGLDEAVRAAADLAGVGITVTLYRPGHDPKNLYVNEAAVQILGRSREELTSAPIVSFFAPEERERYVAIAKSRVGGEPSPGRLGTTRIETVIMRADGTRVPLVSFNGHLKVEGGSITVGFFWDLTRQRTETDRLARVVSSSPDAIALVRGPTILSMNEAGAKLLGIDDPAKVVGRSLEEFLVAEQHALMRERMRASASGTPQKNMVYRLRRTDGGLVSAEVSSIPFEHEGQPALLAFVRDVTSREQLAEQMARAERLAALSTLAAGLAHEINNPLTAAMLQLDVVEKQAVAAIEPAARKDLLDRFAELRRTHTRIGAIMSDIAAFSHGAEEHRAKVDLNVLLKSVERMLAPMLRQRGRYRNEIGVLPKVDADPSRLEQVFMNLLLNAVQALPEEREQNEIIVRGRVTPDGRVCVEVQDNGAGISAENLRRIFDPFFTTKPLGVGTGLGLTVCHNIVAAYGGEMQVDSVLGHGCTMRVFLRPAAGERIAAVSVKGRPRVLIVDDEPHLATTLRMLLEDRHEVLATTQGEQAVSLLLEGAAFDVVLCDVMMPAPDGVEIFRRVTQARPELKGRFIFMTGGVFNPATEDFLNEHRAARVQKPFHAEHVEALIAQVAGAGA
jgi:PAS domain S-box-containing protein